VRHLWGQALASSNRPLTNDANSGVRSLRHARGSACMSRAALPLCGTVRVTKRSLHSPPGAPGRCRCLVASRGSHR
jgi:hypothetical protein